MEQAFWLSKTLTARADAAMDANAVCRLFHGFSHQKCELAIERGTANCFVIGSPSLPALPEQAEYILHAEANGVCVLARDHAALMRGYFALLMKIEYDKQGALFIAPCTEPSGFTVQNRMIHFCVFPETTLPFLHKMLRAIAALQFTHVVIEFWGMLRFDCCEALCWPHAFSKEQIRPILQELRALGVQPIPMFNHLGHAPACRLASGKHVVLDQDPSRYAWFTPDGWSWDVSNPEVLSLLRAVRGELCELFGEGDFFHLGLDESYMYTNSPALFSTLPAYLSVLTREVTASGRRPMIWMDMFLPPEAYGEEGARFCSVKTPAECREILASLAPETVLIDWQYDMKKAPIPTSLYFKDTGFDIMGAPWLDRDNGAAHVQTAVEHGLFGVMDTTWHTLPRDAGSILTIARHMGAATAPWSRFSGRREELATLLRKLSAEPVTYEQAGWMKHQVTLGPEK